MIKITTYNKNHQIGIDKMMNQIALEFDNQILSRPNKQTPQIPKNYWVAIHKEEIIGTIAIITVNKKYGILKKMMLKKEFRGKEIGIAKLLLETATKWCKENNVLTLYLGTMDQFKTAQAFYLKNGFVLILENELPESFLRNPIDNVFFKLNLNT